MVESRMMEDGVLRHGYHSGGYDGKKSKLILELVDKLSPTLPLECLPVIDALRAFRSVVGG